MFAYLGHGAVLVASGVYDFQKRSSLIEVSRAGAQILGKTVQCWPTARSASSPRLLSSV